MYNHVSGFENIALKKNYSSKSITKKNFLLSSFLSVDYKMEKSTNGIVYLKMCIYSFAVDRGKEDQLRRKNVEIYITHV